MENASPFNTRQVGTTTENLSTPKMFRCLKWLRRYEKIDCYMIF
jgi:hypothetical protein